MKILFVSDFFPTGKDLRFSGGVEARTFFVAKYLAKKHKVYVITSRLPKSKKQEQMYGFTVFRPGPMTNYNSGAPNVLETPNRLLFILSAIILGRKLDVDLVDGGNFVDHFIAKLISILKKIPVVFWYPDVFIGQWIKTSGLVGGIAGYVLEKLNLALSANSFIAISVETKKKLIREHIENSKIQTIPCGVELAEFKGKGKKTENFQIICISRLVHYKRIKDLILAFSQAEKEIKIIRLLIIGSGPEKKSLQELSKKLKLTNKISFMQNMPRKVLVRKLVESNLFVLPSEIEGFGISTIEAAAAGIPYIVSDIPVLREVTRNGLGGLLFRAADPENLSNKILRMIRDKNLYQKKTEESKMLSRNYEWKFISSQTEKLYQNII